MLMSAKMKSVHISNESTVLAILWYTRGGGRLFNRPKRKHVLKRAESHCCDVNTSGTFACNFSTFFKVSQTDSF